MKTPAFFLSQSVKPSISFASFRLDTDGSLWRGPSLLHIPPRELGALRLLIANAGRIVTPVQLKQELWSDVHVTADSIPRCISSLRSYLEPDDCIQTVYKRGYRFSAEIQRPPIDPSLALPRLAVLPFSTGYTVPEHLGLAIAEETIVRLLNLGQPVAALIARDSVFALAERKQTAQQIGQTLKADFALTGSLRALATHFRLRAELIRVSDGTQLWVEDFLIPQSCIAGLEAELVERLILRLTSGEVSISAVAELELEEAPSPHRREAYESFLRGHHEWQTMQRHQMQDGLAHLLHAVELDPNLLQAKVEIAHVCVAQAYYGFMAPVVAANHIRRVAASIPNLQQAEGVLPALGWISFHVDHDLPAALDAFSASAHLPHDLWTTHMRAMLALSRQRFSEAIQLLSAALREDPYSPWLHARLAWAYHLKGDGPSSLEQIRHSISLFPNHEGGAFYGSLILAYQGEAGQAAQLAQSLTQRFAYFDLATAVHAYALAREGKREEALIILERLQWLSRERFVLSSFLPAIHVALGDLEAGLHDLKVARDARCPWFFQMLADPRLKELHGHPEFEQMLKILPTMEATVSAEFA